MTNPTLKLPDWGKLVFVKEPPVEFAGVRCTCHRVDPTSLIECNGYIDRVSVGIDPGRNFGITYISDIEILVYNGTMPSAPHDVYAEKAYDLTLEFCDTYCLTKGDVAIVEGASYGDTFGQVGLAEIRQGFRLALKHHGLEPITVAPKSARKVVFGSGNTQAMNIWACLNHNAADALALGLFGSMTGGIK